MSFSVNNRITDPSDSRGIMVADWSVTVLQVSRMTFTVNGRELAKLNYLMNTLGIANRSVIYDYY